MNGYKFKINNVMNMINHNKDYKWLSKIEKLPKQFRKCDHCWRELDNKEKGCSSSTHECVLCGLEKDTSWEPPLFGYNKDIIDIEIENV